MRRNKYNNRKTKVDGITFDSAKEAKRYKELKLMERAGEIVSLKLQEPFVFSINGEKMFSYVSDFTYFDIRKEERVIEDAKGYKTDIYRLKKKIIESDRSIKITEI